MPESAREQFEGNADLTVSPSGPASRTGPIASSILLNCHEANNVLRCRVHSQEKQACCDRFQVEIDAVTPWPTLVKGATAILPLFRHRKTRRSGLVKCTAQFHVLFAFANLVRAGRAFGCVHARTLSCTWETVLRLDKTRLVVTHAHEKLISTIVMSDAGLVVSNRPHTYVFSASLAGVQAELKYLSGRR